MNLTLDYGAHRSVAPIVAAVGNLGVTFDSVQERYTWPEYLELQVSGELDFQRLSAAITGIVAALCPTQTLIPVRIDQGPEAQDLLYSIPCDDWQLAVSALADDVRRYTSDLDAFRSWFRQRWTGMEDEREQTERELAQEPLTVQRILEYLDPPRFRDWRPIQHYIEKTAGCTLLAEAMAAASTSTQRWRLAYAVRRRRRSCVKAIPFLIAWLRDDDPEVRREAADALGPRVRAIRNLQKRSDAGHAAEAALLAYLKEYPNDGLYLARISLGLTGYEPGRQYLESAARRGSEQERESARKGLAAFDAGGYSRNGG
jgi:hypothetical protein